MKVHPKSNALLLTMSVSVLLRIHAALASFTTQSTLIPVPAAADGTTNGDTTATTTNTIQLDATVYIPDGATSPAPVIIVLHGFAGAKDNSKNVAIAEDFANAGYVVLTPTLRGFGDSDGKVSLAGPNEVNDLKTIILAMQTGSIGDSPAVSIPVTSDSKFGVTGISYGGGLTWELLRTHVTNLVAVAPIIGWTDLYQALAPNDVPKLSYTVGLFASGYNPQDPNYSQQMFDWLGDFLDGKPEKTRMGDPKDNADWRSVIFNPEELAVPTFVIQGWNDFLFPAEQATSLFETTNNIPFFKLYIGGIGHPRASGSIDSEEALYVRAQVVRWFDQWLKGTDTGILAEPRVTLAPERTQDWSTNALVQVSAYPIPGTTTNILYINLNGLTTATPGLLKSKKLPATARGSRTLSSILKTIGVGGSAITEVLSVNDILNSGATDILDPNISTSVDENASKIGFDSDPLPGDLRVVGLPVVQLYVSAKKTNAYYFVQVEEHFPNGNAKLVTRGAFKDHTADSKTPHLIQFSPFAVNHLFSAGSRIRLRIASRDYPFFLPNTRQSQARIYRDTAHPSALLLPVAP
jgi:predicted acyl esterase